MSRSVWKSNSISTDARMSIGLFPDNMNYFSAVSSGRLKSASGADSLACKIERTSYSLSCIGLQR